jgi:hypothetical protein
MLTIQTGRLSPRPPIHCHPDALVEVLGADNHRARKRAAELATGEILAGFGVVARIERGVEGVA